MENNKNFLNHAIQWGIILGVVRVLLDVLSKVFDVSFMIYYLTFILGFLIEIIIIVIAIRLFRDKLNNGVLNISQSIKIGLIMMIIVSIFIFLVRTFFETDFAISKTIEMIEKFQPEKLDEIMEQMDEAKENPRYFMSFALNIGWYMFLGLLISAITGAILKKEEDQF